MTVAEVTTVIPSGIAARVEILRKHRYLSFHEVVCEALNLWCELELLGRGGRDERAAGHTEPATLDRPPAAPTDGRTDAGVHTPPDGRPPGVAQSPARGCRNAGGGPPLPEQSKGRPSAATAVATTNFVRHRAGGPWVPRAAAVDPPA
jgi:hypothetical protein